MNKKLQVFVSSTYTDLIEERQAAVQAILDAGHIPAGMELFKAGNESQLKTIYKWIDESDVYMLILGGRYGSVESKSGKSYTQLEYEYAISKDIPVFAVVLSQLFLTSKINSLGLEKTMEQDNPDNHKSFKSLVMSKIIREVDDCKDIKIAIHTTLNEFMNEYDLIGWTRGNIQNPYTIDFQSLYKVFQKTILYTQNDEPIDANKYLIMNIRYFIEGISEIYYPHDFVYYSNFFLQNGIIEKGIDTINHFDILRLSKFGTDYYNFAILTQS